MNLDILQLSYNDEKNETEGVLYTGPFTVTGAVSLTRSATTRRRPALPPRRLPRLLTLTLHRDKAMELRF
jgi:hypothetical protein